MKAIVTGGSSGIGAEISVLLSARQVKVVLVGRRVDKLAETAGRCPGAVIFSCDLSALNSAPALVAAHPDVDILVNCAGFTQTRPFVECEWSEIASTIEVNATAVAYLCHAYARVMHRRGYGFILNVASSAALAPAPGYAAYAASKAFVLHLSQSLTAELRGSSVRVSCLIPGPTATAFSSRAGLREVPGAMSPVSVAKYAVELMERGGPVGVPGARNVFKQCIKRIVPSGLWSFFARRYIAWRSL